MSVFSRTQLKKSLSRKILFIFTVIVIDAVTTVWLMYQGYGELNPIMEWVAKNWSIAGMATVKIIWSLSLLLLILKVKEFHKFVDCLIVGYFVLYAGGWWAQFIWEVIR